MTAPSSPSRNGELTIRYAQQHQPWTVPYAAAIDIAAQGPIPHILGSHTALHAMKSVGKIATVFEALDHSRSTGEAGKSEPITEAQIETLRSMSADLLTAAIRFANLYGFDLAEALVARVREKNDVEWPTFAVSESVPYFKAPFPLPKEVGAVLAEYDLILARADLSDPEWDFVMRAADWREIREFFAKLRRVGPPIEIVNPPRPA